MIKAVLIEVDDGPFYEALIQSVPQKGEFISLVSNLEKHTGHPFSHKYEIVHVIHEIHDVTEKVKKSLEGYHAVTLVVKKTESSAFNYA